MAAHAARQKSPVGYLALVRSNYNFRSLWTGQIISLFGDWFDLIASASLVATLWAVEDLSTARLMETFYARLADGWEKGAALRCAQLDLLRQPSSEVPTHHPYFWAPFFLVGASGPL